MPPVDHSAEIARQEEQARQANILTGQGKIDTAFSAFDPAFFQKYQNDYLGYYNPQIDKQFGTTKRDLRYDLARKGTLNSTPGQTRFADLIDQLGQRRDELASNANAATAGLRSNVEQNKHTLYNQNTVSADPTLAAQGAAGSVGALMTPPVYSPLADLFAGVINSYGAYQAGAGNQIPMQYWQQIQPGYYGGTSSGRNSVN
jgi:hypothetical protein